MCKQDLALNCPQELICHEIQPNQANEMQSESIDTE